ncbi:MAG TPA: DUF4417 domain-containing protein [Leptospiraceae bacterium]|nr:DUF4417 domain-containing protein [Leptospiraceae bacterium]
MFDIFPSDNEYGIPDLDFSDPPAPDALVPYNIRVRSQLGYKGLGIHFFLDDYRFEQTWVKPEVGIERVKAAEVALTPDFSLYMDMPKAVQIYNTYRNRWLGKFWQERGIKVIPTLSWSDRESFKFCFLGIPEKMTVAVSTVSVNKGILEDFMNGFACAMERLNPSKVLCYGKILPEMLEYISEDKIKHYRPNFEGLRNLRKKTRDSEIIINPHAA